MAYSEKNPREKCADAEKGRVEVFYAMEIYSSMY